MLLRPRCQDCAYWHTEARAEGQCRRHAPPAQLIPHAGVPGALARWPETAADDWCGDFQRTEHR